MAKLIKLPLGQKAPDGTELSLECCEIVYMTLSGIAHEFTTYDAINGALSGAATLCLAVDESNESQIARMAFVKMCRDSADAMEKALDSQRN